MWSWRIFQQNRLAPRWFRERQMMTRHRHAASTGVPETIRATGIITSEFHFWRDFAYLARFMLGEGFLVIPERMTSCLDNSFRFL